MIKIIEDGIKEYKYKQEADTICPQCHCKFSFEEQDLHLDLTGLNFLNCPWCYEQMRINPSVFYPTKKLSITKIKEFFAK